MPLLVLLLAAPAAHAHKLLVEHRVLPGGRVRVVSRFESGDAPLEGTIRVLRANNEILSQGTLDSEGRYLFRVTQPEALTVVVQDTGHRAELKISADELARQLFRDAALLIGACQAGAEQPLAALGLLAANLPPEGETAPADEPDSVPRGGIPIVRVLLGVVLLLGLAAVVALRRSRS